MARPSRIVIFLLIPLLVGSAEYIAATTQVRALHNQLEPFFVPPVTFRGDTYIVENRSVFKKEAAGEKLVSWPRTQQAVLRTAYISVLLRIQPSFSLAGSDPVEVQKALVAYEQYATLAASHYPPEEGALFESLFDTRFLRTLNELEAIRLSLVRGPSHDLLFAYERALKKTIADASRVSRASQEHYASAEMRNPRRKFHVFGGVTNYPVLVNALIETETRYVQAGKKYAQMLRCPFATLPSCEFIVPEVPQRNTKPLIQNSTPETVRIFLEKIAKSVPHTDDPLHRHEVFAVSPDPCFPDNAVSYYTLYTSVEEKNKYLMEESPRTLPVYLNDIFFYDLTIPEAYTLARPELPDVPRDQYPFVGQPPVSSYMCISGFENFARIQTLSDIVATIQKLRFFSRSDTNEPKELALLEEKLLEQTTIDEYRIAEYLKVVQETLRTGDQWAYETVGEDLFDIYTLLHASRGNSSSFSNVIRFGMHSALFDLLRAESIPPIDGISVGQVKPQLLLTTFNTTIATSSAEWFVPVSPDLKGFLMTTYLTDKRVRDRYPLEKLPSILKITESF